ncbi:MAG: sigma-70 family RNA polymerase sigma factor [Planctomycetes bacterium]|nr:sigma-70 family RNA polymerase sigma factor [Planctomycetota bacterium]
MAERHDTQPPAGDARDDRALLEAIAGQKDRDAFAALAERHERAAYNLALHLTHNPGIAEEALQEALLRAWRFAHTFGEDGSVRSWLLRIVAHESLRLMRGRLRDRKEMNADETIETVAERAAPDEKAAQDEQLAALRRCVDALPSMERQVVALYYLAGMEQREIGDELALSQQVVSYRIKEALKRLRAGLTAAGFAAAMPLLDGPGLGAVLESGAPAPAHAVAGALAKIGGLSAGRLAGASARATRRAAAAKWGAAPVIAGLLAVVAVGAAVWVSQEEPPGAKAEASPAVAPTAAAAAEAKAEILVDEDFSGTQVSPFVTHQMRKVGAGRIFAVQKQGALCLIAGGSDVTIDERKPYPVCDLESIAVPAKGQPLLVWIPNRSLLRDGPYKVAFTFESQDGTILHESEQASTAQDADVTMALKDAAGPMEADEGSLRYIGVLFSPVGRVAVLKDDGSLQDITRKGGVPVESVRMRLRASAGPGKGFIIWFIDRIRVQRLARWPENGRIEIPEGFHYNPDWAPEKP